MAAAFCNSGGFHANLIKPEWFLKKNKKSNKYYFDKNKKYGTKDFFHSNFFAELVKKWVSIEMNPINRYAR